MHKLELKTNSNFIKKNWEQKIKIKFKISINKRTSLNFYMIMQFFEGGERSGRISKGPLASHCHPNTVTCCFTRKISEGTPGNTMKRKFWMSGEATCTTWKVRASFTRWCMLCTCQLIYIYIYTYTQILNCSAVNLTMINNKKKTSVKI